MNSVQRIYAPPRLIALAIAVIVFAIYQIGWRETLISPSRFEYPAPLWLAIACSVVTGYGMAMLGWLIARTKGQMRETFRPTRGRILGAIMLILFIPFYVLSYVPLALGGLMLFGIGQIPLEEYALLLSLVVPTYLLSAMIVRNTYQRRWMRFGLFTLAFWTAYSVLTLVMGVNIFHI